MEESLVLGILVENRFVSLLTTYVSAKGRKVLGKCRGSHDRPEQLILLVDILVRDVSY